MENGRKLTSLEVVSLNTVVSVKVDVYRAQTASSPIRKLEMVACIGGDPLWWTKQSDNIFTAHVWTYSREPISWHTMWHEVNDNTCRHSEDGYEPHQPATAQASLRRVLNTRRVHGLTRHKTSCRDPAVHATQHTLSAAF